MDGAVPRYFLYGEALDDVERSFLHVEPIQQRSSVHDWTIRAHAHPEHHQVLLLTKGAGSVRMEDRWIAFEPIALVAVPALTVHSFRFLPGTDGWVVTVSTSFLHAALEGDAALGRVFDASGTCVQAEPGSVDLDDAFRSLHAEFIWQAPGRRIAVKAHLQRILVSLARLTAAAPTEVGPRRRHAEIVARFRQAVEREFRSQPKLPALARELGVTTAALNAACQSMIGKSALTVVHDRMLIEAKRNLLYTSMPVGQVAAALGFADPAYFNRFFSRRAGVSPGAFREAARSAS